MAWLGSLHQVASPTKHRRPNPGESGCPHTKEYHDTQQEPWSLVTLRDVMGRWQNLDIWLEGMLIAIWLEAIRTHGTFWLPKKYNMVEHMNRLSGCPPFRVGAVGAGDMRGGVLETDATSIFILHSKKWTRLLGECSYQKQPAPGAFWCLMYLVLNPPAECGSARYRWRLQRPPTRLMVSWCMFRLF